MFIKSTDCPLGPFSSFQFTSYYDSNDRYHRVYVISDVRYRHGRYGGMSNHVQLHAPKPAKDLKKYCIENNSFYTPRRPRFNQKSYEPLNLAQVRNTSYLMA